MGLRRRSLCSYWHGILLQAVSRLLGPSCSHSKPLQSSNGTELTCFATHPHMKVVLLFVQRRPNRKHFWPMTFYVLLALVGWVLSPERKCFSLTIIHCERKMTQICKLIWTKTLWFRNKLKQSSNCSVVDLTQCKYSLKCIWFAIFFNRLEHSFGCLINKMCSG